VAKRLLALLCSFLLVGASSALAEVPDPLETGADGVNQLDYEAGSMLIQIPGSPNNPPSTPPNHTRREFTQYLRGSLHYPDPNVNPGPWPVVVHVHGNHSNCMQLGGPIGPPNEQTLFDDCTQTSTGTPVTNREPLPNAQGYDYMGSNLASHGYLTISIDQDEMMAYQTGDDRGMYSRSQLIGAHLDALWKANQGEAAGDLPAELAGRLDFSKIGMMGHSRGGDGVTAFIDYNRTRPAPLRRYPLKAVLSLAPVDYERRAPYGVAYGTILPLCDGDVSNVQGARFFERSQYIVPGDPFPRVQFASHGAQHGRYNHNWIGDDAGSYTSSTTGRDLACGEGRQHIPASPGQPEVPAIPMPGNIRLTRPDQEKQGLALMNSFFRRYVGDELDFEPYMTGEMGLPDSACPTEGTPPVPPAAGGQPVACEESLLTSYFGPGGRRRDVIRPEPENALNVNALGGRLSGSGFANPYKDSAGVAPATGFDPAPDTPGGYDWCTPEPLNFTGSPFPTSDKPCPLPANTAVTPGSQSNEREQAPVNRSYGRQLALAWDNPATLDAAVPAKHGDVSSYGTLALAAAVNFFDLRNPQRSENLVDPMAASAVHPEAVTQDFEIALIDADGEEAVVAAGAQAYGNALHPSVGAIMSGLLNNRGRRHILLNEIRVPLADFAGVDLTKIRNVELRFGGEGMPATGSIQLADVRFQEGGEPQVFKASDVSGFPSAAPPRDEMTGKTFFAPKGCVDHDGPVTNVRAASLSRRGLTVKGRADDVGCAGVGQVRVAVARKAGRRYRHLGAKGRLGKSTKSSAPRWLRAKGKGAWSRKVKAKLPPGTYVVRVRALDKSGNPDRTITLKRKVR
jgi:hypothetical protein